MANTMAFMTGGVSKSNTQFGVQKSVSVAASAGNVQMGLWPFGARKGVQAATVAAGSRRASLHDSLPPVGERPDASTLLADYGKFLGTLNPEEIEEFNKHPVFYPANASGLCSPRSN